MEHTDRELMLRVATECTACRDRVNEKIDELTDTVHKLAKKQWDMELWRARFQGYVAGIASIGGLIGAGIVLAIQKLFNL